MSDDPVSPMHNHQRLPDDLGRLRENLIDLKLAIADAFRAPDRDDPRAAAWLDE